MTGSLFLTLVLPGLLLLIWVVANWLLRDDNRDLQRTAEGRCVHCGYDLRATPLRCPECGAAAVRFTILDPDDRIAFQKAHAIYSDSIAPSAQKPRELMLQMLGREDYRFVLAWQGGQVAGAAVLFIAATAGFTLLEYLAVRSDLRGLGLGSELFQETGRIAASALGASPGPMLIEVESEPGAASATGTDAGADASAAPLVPIAIGDAIESARRQAFYRRQGCRQVVGLRYLLPLHDDGSAPAMDLLLFRPPAILTRDDLSEWLSIIYTRVYGRPRDDPRITAMLRGVGDQIAMR